MNEQINKPHSKNSSSIVQTIKTATSTINKSIKIHGLKNFLTIGTRMLQNVDIRDLITIAKGYSTELEYKENKLATFANIELTYDCSRKCLGCYIPNELKIKSETISEKILNHTVEELIKQKIAYIGLLGGEPLSRKNMPLIYHITTKYPSTLFSTYTNGDYISSHGIGELTKVHNLMYGISIDGLESHNKIRGKNSLENVLRTFDILHNERKFFGAGIGVRKETINEVTSYDFLKLLAKSGVQYMHFIKIRTPDSANDLSYEEFDETINKISPYFKKIPIATFFGTGTKSRKSSYLPYTYLTINPYGELRLSRTDLDDTVLGNVMKDDMLGLLMKSKENYSKIITNS